MFALAVLSVVILRTSYSSLTFPPRYSCDGQFFLLITTRLYFDPIVVSSVARVRKKKINNIPSKIEGTRYGRITYTFFRRSDFVVKQIRGFKTTTRRLGVYFRRALTSVKDSNVIVVVRTRSDNSGMMFAAAAAVVVLKYKRFSVA